MPATVFFICKVPVCQSRTQYSSKMMDLRISPHTVRGRKQTTKRGIIYSGALPDVGILTNEFGGQAEFFQAESKQVKSLPHLLFSLWPMPSASFKNNF